MTDKMREEFEAWLKAEWPKALTIKYNTGDYRSDTVQQSWVAWQASREALVIELPEEDEPDYHSPGHANQHYAIGFNDGRSQCKEAIEAAGLKVKP